VPDAIAWIVALPVPLLLIGSVVVVSVLGWLVAPLQNGLMLIPDRVRRGQVHRLLTAGWVHTDVIHLAVNMVTLYFFIGPALAVLGPSRTLVLYLTAVPMAFLPTTVRHLRDPRYVSLGASGAVAAVMLSAVLLQPKLKVALLLLPIPVPGLVFAAVYLAYSAWRAHGSGGGVNHDAHFSGAVYGAVFTFVFEPARVERALRSLF
jgi:membrane associated rhomboid family serine protease